MSDTVSERGSTGHWDFEVQIDEVCDRFEAAWKAGQRPRIEDYVEESPAPARAALLREIIPLDIEYRKRQGETPTTEEYLDRFPYLSTEEFRDRPGSAVPRPVGPPVDSTEDEKEPSLPTLPPSTSESAAPAFWTAPGPSRYTREKFHKGGGLGDVYKAYDEELRREVALKRIKEEHADNPRCQRDFLREAEITGKLEHPGVVPIYGLVQGPDGNPSYAMRFIEGESLKDAIHKFHEADKAKRDPGERAVALRQLLNRFIAVCNTLAFAHNRGIIHRDLKPANIMLGKYGETLVVDWGLARPFARTESERASGEDTLIPAPKDVQVPDATRPGDIKGTLSYMSPEQAEGRWDLVGPASDIYSLGATLYELLTGVAPVRGGDYREVLSKAQRADFPHPRSIKSDIAKPLEAICLKAMNLDRADRYPTADLIGKDLELWLADEPVTAHKEPWFERARRLRRRHKPLAASLAVALLLIVIGAAIGGFSWQRQRQELRQGVDAALTRMEEFRDKERWKEAEAWQEQAENRLGAGGPADLRARVDQARRDLEVVGRLEALRLRRWTLVEGKFDNRTADQDYAAAFRERGFGEEGEEADAVAARVRDSAVWQHLVAALDDLAAATHDPNRRAWLLKVARRADRDPWRDRFRDPKLWAHPAALEALARELLRDNAQLGKQKPQLLVALGGALQSTKAESVPLLAAAQARYPADFWLNFQLGNAFASANQWNEAVGYDRGALALRPDSSAAHNNLGVGLHQKKQLDEAIREFRSAIELDPKYASAHYNLAVALRTKKQLDGAIGEYRTAIELDPKFAPAHNNLGIALRDKKQLDDAIREYRTAIDLDPMLALAHYNLGIALYEMNQLDEAIREYRATIELEPDDAEAHCNLGQLLQLQGEFADALTELRMGHELGSKRPGWPYPSDAWVRETEGLVQLEGKLVQMLHGKDSPANNKERLQLAWMCKEHKKLYAASARFYAEMFDDDVKLADDMQQQFRYNAACAAALAGSGQGKDADKLDDKDLVRLRSQSRAWLRADLEAWAKLTDQAKADDRAAAVKTLRHWQTDPDLAGVRDKEALATLPETEREAWRMLWADVAQVLKKVEESKKEQQCKIGDGHN
jgi:serine/threonine-protein kinase